MSKNKSIVEAHLKRKYHKIQAIYFCNRCKEWYPLKEYRLKKFMCCKCFNKLPSNLPCKSSEVSKPTFDPEAP